MEWLVNFYQGWSALMEEYPTSMSIIWMLIGVGLGWTLDGIARVTGLDRPCHRAVNWVASYMLTPVEALFGLVPELGPDQVVDNKGRPAWLAPEIYYFSHIRSWYVRDRIRAILARDRNAVSFYRRRTAYIRAHGWSDPPIE